MVTVPKIHRKLFRDITTAKVQFGAVVFIILLGVALFIGAYEAYLNLDQSYEESYDRLRMADYWISVDYVDEKAAREMDKIPGVTAQGRIVQEVFVDMEQESGERVVGRVVSLPPHKHPAVNDVYINNGTYFSSLSGREILVEQHFADYHKFKPGDWLTIERGNSKARFKIAGIVTSPEYIWVAKSAQEPMPSPRVFGVLYMTQPVAENLFEMDGLINEINLTVSQTTDHDKVIDDIKLILRKYHIKRLTSKDDTIIIRTRKIDVIKGVRSAYMIERADHIGNMLLKQDLEGFEQLAFLFPLLFLSMASMTIYVLLNRLIESQQVQIGLMRALGYGKAAVLFHYLGFSLILGIVGSLLGVGLGFAMGRGLTNVYADQLSLPFIMTSMHWNLMLMGTIIGVMVPLIAGFLPAWSTMKMRPAEAMRPRTPATGHRTVLEILLPFMSKLPSIFKLPLRNIFRNLRRSLFMGMGVASAVILILVSMSFVDAMEKALDTQYDVIQNYDALVYLQGMGATSTAAYARNLNGVKQAEAILEMPYRIRYGDNTADTSVMGLSPESSMYNLLTPEGYPIDVVEDGILIPFALKDKIGAEIGDTVRLEPIVGTVGETEKRLAGFVDTPIGGRAFMPLQEVQKMLHTPGAATGILLTFDGKPSTNLLKKLYNLPGAASIEFVEDTLQLLDEQMGFFWAFIGMMLAMGAALGIAIIFNSVTVNVLQRTREIAIMRAMGTSNTRLTIMLTLENLAIACLGIIVGTELGKYLAHYYFEAMNTSAEGTVSMILTILPRTYIIAAVSAVVILLVSQIPAIRQVYRLSLATATKDWTA